MTNIREGITPRGDQDRPSPKPLHPWGANIRTDASWLPRNDADLAAEAATTRTEPEPHEGGTASEPTEYVVPWTVKDSATGMPTRGPLYHALAHADVLLPVNGTSGDSALEAAIANQMSDLFRLFKERQRKYGPGNIAAFGDLGVLVRCSDKLARLRKHYMDGTGDMPDESVDDAWSDLAVYAVIALVCRDGGWPGWAVKERSDATGPTAGRLP